MCVAGFFFFPLDTIHIALRNDSPSVLRKAALGGKRPGLHSYRAGKGLSSSLVTLRLGFSFLDGERNLSHLSVLEAVTQIRGQIAKSSAWQGEARGRVCPSVREDLQRGAGAWNAGRRKTAAGTGRSPCRDERGHALFLFCQDQLRLRKQLTRVTCA